jgi:hypothetical protein
MFGWFRGFADPEIASIEAISGATAGSCDYRTLSVVAGPHHPPDRHDFAGLSRPVPGPSLGQMPTVSGRISLTRIKQQTQSQQGS